MARSSQKYKTKTPWIDMQPVKRVEDIAPRFETMAKDITRRRSEYHLLGAFASGGFILVANDGVF